MFYIYKDMGSVIAARKNKKWRLVNGEIAAFKGVEIVYIRTVFGYGKETDDIKIAEEEPQTEVAEDTVEEIEEVVKETVEEPQAVCKAVLKHVPMLRKFQPR